MIKTILENKVDLSIDLKEKDNKFSYIAKIHLRDKEMLNNFKSYSQKINNNIMCLNGVFEIEKDILASRGITFNTQKAMEVFLLCVEELFTHTYERVILKELDNLKEKEEQSKEKEDKELTTREELENQLKDILLKLDKIQTKEIIRDYNPKIDVLLKIFYLL